MTRTLRREAHGQTVLPDDGFHKHVAKFWEANEPITWTVSRHKVAVKPSMLVVVHDGNKDTVRQGLYELAPDASGRSSSRYWRQVDGDLIDLLPPAVLDSMWNEVLR